MSSFLLNWLQPIGFRAMNHCQKAANLARKEARECIRPKKKKTRRDWWPRPFIQRHTPAVLLCVSVWLFALSVDNVRRRRSCSNKPFSFQISLRTLTILAGISHAAADGDYPTFLNDDDI